MSRNRHGFFWPAFFWGSLLSSDVFGFPDAGLLCYPPRFLLLDNNLNTHISSSRLEVEIIGVGLGLQIFPLIATSFGLVASVHFLVWHPVASFGDLLVDLSSQNRFLATSTTREERIQTSSTAARDWNYIDGNYASLVCRWKDAYLESHTC